MDHTCNGKSDVDLSEEQNGTSKIICMQLKYVKNLKLLLGFTSCIYDEEV